MINRELVGPFKHQRKRPTDIALTGDLVEQVNELVRLAGWQQDLNKLIISDGVVGGSEIETCSKVLTGKDVSVDYLATTNNQTLEGPNTMLSSSVSTCSSSSEGISNEIVDMIRELKIDDKA